MIKIAVNGAVGRMGSRILALASEAPKDFEIAGAFEHEKSGQRGQRLSLGKQSLLVEGINKSSLKGKGVLIDFSGPTGTSAALVHAAKAGWGVVVGTTGLEPAIQKSIQKFSRTIPIVYSANMSVGVNLIAKLVALAAEKLGKDFDIEITEAHHRHKKDAPSGTALLLAEAITRAKGWQLEKVLKMRKPGKSETERSNEEIGMQVIRAGEIVGDHTVLFAGLAETIEITHRAQSRDTFARGALTAATFLSKKKSGLFTMADVLGI